MAAAALTLPLAGCLGSTGPVPSDADVTQAVRAAVLANNTPAATAADAGAPAPTVTVTGVKNLGCNPAPDYKGYLCETIIDARSATQGASRKTRLVRMVHGPDGWRATMQ